MPKISMRIWQTIQTGVLSGVVTASRTVSRASRVLPALLALVVPAVLAQISLSATRNITGSPASRNQASLTPAPGSPIKVGAQIFQGTMPGTWNWTVTANVTDACKVFHTQMVVGAQDSSGNPIGTTRAFSTNPPATSVTTLTNGFVSVDYLNGMATVTQVAGNVSTATGTPAVLVVGVSVVGNSSCSSPSNTFPLAAGTAKLTITKTAFGASGQLLDGGMTYSGQPMFFHITVTNVGTAPTVGNITITDQLPPALKVDRYGANTLTIFDKAEFDPTRNLVTKTIPSLARGESFALDIPTEVGSKAAEGAFSNTATVTGGGDPLPESATVTLNNTLVIPLFSCDDADLCVGPAGGSMTAPGPAPLAVSTSGRFRVRVYWKALHQGTSGQGHAVPLTSDTGYFWFFSANNIELVIKVVDGRAVNGKFWIFYGALTNVEYIIEVVDSVTGAVQGYFNPQDNQASNADTSPFGSATTVETESEFQLIPMNDSDPAACHPTMSASEPVETLATAACVADPLTQCLNGGRFQVRVHWDALHLGTSGEGQAVPITSDTGYFWFFSANNIELVIKVVDGRPVNGKFWVFYGALTNVQYTITITDTVTGAVKRYFNPQDTQASASDTSAF